MSAMQRTLEDFLRALRNNGVPVAPGEAIDAHLAVAAAGYADRRLLRDSLCVTLAKTEAEVARFDRCFDTFFSRPEHARQNTEYRLEPPPNAPAIVRWLMREDEVSIVRALENAAGQVGAGEIALPTQRSLLARRILDEMGLRELEDMIHALRSSGNSEDGGLADRLSFERRGLFDRARAYMERQAALHAGEAGRRLRENLLIEQNIAAVPPEDFEAMEVIVRRMAKRLAANYARRRRHAHRGKLDARATLRRSMAHGGVPFDVIWKTKVVQKPRIVVICDVSRSVATAAQFLLLFLYSLGETVEKLDAFAFSDRLVSVNDLLNDSTVDRAITGILARIGFRPTDYGRALADFRTLHGAAVDRRTTVIVLGDGRTNGANPRLDLMHEIADRARAVIWLNPEPTSLWDQGDSEMHAYRRFCTIARSCNTLKALDSIVEDVLRTYTKT